jgi:hypothetical protein
MISTRTLNPWLRRGQKRDTPCPMPTLQEAPEILTHEELRLYVRDALQRIEKLERLVELLMGRHETGQPYGHNQPHNP